MSRKLPCFVLLLFVVVSSASCGPNTQPKKGGAGGGNTNNSGQKQPPPPPCHPGCFPHGTLVETPDGPRPIVTIKSGDVVTLVNDDGTTTSGPVHSTFETCNRLVEVETAHGNLLTTETQPLLVADGSFRAAGKLTAGDQIWRWDRGERHMARVLAIVPTDKTAPVFNLVVGDSAVFIAGGFLARGKPPLVADSE